MSDLDAIYVAAPYGQCDCGRVTTFHCFELWPPNGMTACKRWLCASGCPEHRHALGTMGYHNFTTAKAEFIRDEPEGPGLWEYLRYLGRKFWSVSRMAQYTWDKMYPKWVPPAPLPVMRLYFPQGQVFEARGEKMVQLTPDEIAAREAKDNNR